MGTWNLYWCNDKQHGRYGGIPNPRADEPTPHWCDCKSDGWKDSGLSSPISHDHQNHDDKDYGYCNCMTIRGYKWYSGKQIPRLRNCEWPNPGEMTSVTCHFNKDL